VYMCVCVCACACVYVYVRVCVCVCVEIGSAGNDGPSAYGIAISKWEMVNEESKCMTEEKSVLEDRKGRGSSPLIPLLRYQNRKNMCSAALAALRMKPRPGWNGPTHDASTHP
jgi:hypothetical protein